MNCDEMRELVDRHVAGTLAPDRREAADRHLAGCAECRADLDAARALAPTLAGLPRTIEPPDDLWPDIRSRLSVRPARQLSRGRIAALALAAAVVLMAGSSAVTLWLTHDHSQEMTAAPSPTVIEAGYVDASAQLLRALAAERDKLSPATVATLQRNLAVIDAAIAESRAALAADPGNHDLAALLWAGYRQKVALLQQVTRIAERT